MEKNQYEIYHENKKHTPNDFPYNTYLCSIPLDFKSVNLHWHNEVELIVIKKGQGLVNVNLVTYTVNAGDVVFVFPGQLHSISQKDYSIMEYENILFKSSLIKSSGYDLCNDKFIQPLLSGNLNIYPVINSNFDFHDSLYSLINEIDKLCDKRPYAYQLAVKSYLFQIFYLLISNCGRNEIKPISKKALEKIKTILSYVAEHFQDNISIEEIAGHCFYSKSYFMKFFKETMGMSFVQYLNDYRLEVAAKLLTTTSDDIINIAINTGFDNLSYFNRCFKKKYGITPGKYRKDARD